MIRLYKKIYKTRRIKLHPTLKAYIPVANIIAQTFGRSCEVAIHDLTQPESSVVYVANGTVTGRKEGQSFNHLIPQVLLSKNFQDDCTVNYTFDTADGKKIKSSSALIRDLKGEAVGMLCINYDLTIPYLIQGELASFLPQTAAEPLAPEEEETLGQDVLTIVDELIDNIIGSKEAGSLKRKDNLDIIRFMDEKGIFLVKGAIDKVAAGMGLSKVTIYSYLDDVRGKK
jgi:predicted transcriptional regulator YheO